MTDDIDEYAGLPMAELYPYVSARTTYRYYPVE